jgi:hypothetical protein
MDPGRTFSAAADDEGAQPGHENEPEQPERERLEAVQGGRGGPVRDPEAGGPGEQDHPGLEAVGHHPRLQVM